jgi:hypothetical protein
MPTAQGRRRKKFRGGSNLEPKVLFRAVLIVDLAVYSENGFGLFRPLHAAANAAYTVWSRDGRGLYQSMGWVGSEKFEEPMNWVAIFLGWV